MSCRITKKVCKTEGETKRWAFDYAGYDTDTGAWAFLVNGWSQGTIFVSDATIRPTFPTGFQYSSGGGQSGQIEPRWPTTIGGTVADGSITWTCEAIGNDSLDATISSSTWLAETGITAANDDLANTGGVQLASIEVSGGTAGNTYWVANTVTLSDGTIEESVLEVSVE
jgi:hypothetical protein